MEDSNSGQSTRIDAESMFVGKGEPTSGATVVVTDGRIEYAGPSASAPKSRNAVGHKVKYLIPGLWDAHVHFWGSTAGNSIARSFTAPALAGARSVADARTLLSEGFTSVRCLGGVGPELATSIDEGSCEGPKVYAAGAMLSIPGGHADPKVGPLWQTAHESITRRLCTGVDDSVRAVREQIRRGAKVIKVCVSGGVMSDADVEEQQFSEEELKAIVGEASRARRAVAAHAHGESGILAAVKAGVTTIEHGSRLTEEAADEMKSRGTILVPTRHILESASKREDLSIEAVTKAQALNASGVGAVKMAKSIGVTIASGSDLGVSGSSGTHAYSRGRSEIAALVRAGLTPVEALTAATANGPLTLGAGAPDSGRIEEGFPADLVGLDFDPIASPESWEATDVITKVWKGGVLVG